eukprot:EG_transcript_16300
MPSMQCSLFEEKARLLVQQLQATRDRRPVRVKREPSSDDEGNSTFVPPQVPAAPSSKRHKSEHHSGELAAIKAELEASQELVEQQRMQLRRMEATNELLQQKVSCATKEMDSAEQRLVEQQARLSTLEKEKSLLTLQIQSLTASPLHRRLEMHEATCRQVEELTRTVTAYEAEMRSLRAYAKRLQVAEREAAEEHLAELARLEARTARLVAERAELRASVAQLGAELEMANRQQEVLQGKLHDFSGLLKEKSKEVDLLKAKNPRWPSFPSKVYQQGNLHSSDDMNSLSVLHAAQSKPRDATPLPTMWTGLHVPDPVNEFSFCLADNPSPPPTT